MPAVLIEDVSRHFGDVVAVNHVNLSIERGEFVTLLGPSGCGKTTTLRMVAGLEQNTAGRISIGDRVVSDAAAGFRVPPDRRQLGMLFQSYAIWPHMTVFDNVAYPLRIRRRPRTEINDRVHTVLRLVEMESFADRPAPALSGGQQQRVAIARALVFEPEVLLLDEPLSNLDANLREEMRFEIRRLHDEFRITTVYVTHDQAEAMVTSDRIAVMNLGRVEQVADPHTLYNRPKTRFVAGFIGRTNFIEGTAGNGQIEFGSFALPSLEGAPPSGKVTVSVRPQSMRLTRAQATNGQPQVAVTVAERAYLGEFWDYVVTLPEGAARLRVTAPPLEIYQVGESAWLAFDPKQMTPIA